MPYLREQRSGHVINIASIVGHQGDKDELVLLAIEMSYAGACEFAWVKGEQAELICDTLP